MGDLRSILSFDIWEDRNLAASFFMEIFLLFLSDLLILDIP